MFFNALNSQGFLINKQTVNNLVTTYVQIFTYTGSDQTFTIPSTLQGTVNIKCWGAGGATQGSGNIATKMYQTGWGGGGGYTEANFSQASMTGRTLTIIVGQGGQTVNTTTKVGNTYGGGGGQGQNWNSDANWGAASGGGRSAVRITGPVEIITAGGGGGGGGTLAGTTDGTGAGGPGGGSSGGDAQYGNFSPNVDYSGKGGSQSAAGAIGANSFTSTEGTIGGQFYGGFGALYAAGGGGGYYGGGCGGISRTNNTNNFTFGGGGGGSSFISTANGGTQVEMLRGNNNTVAGTEKIPTGYSSLTIGSGGASNPTVRGINGNPGLPGLVVITYTA